MSTQAVRVWDRVTWCHLVDQDHPDRFGGVMTVCGMLVPWRSTRLGSSPEVDCRRCIEEQLGWRRDIEEARRRVWGEQGRPS